MHSGIPAVDECPVGHSKNQVPVCASEELLALTFSTAELGGPDSGQGVAGGYLLQDDTVLG